MCLISSLTWQPENGPCSRRVAMSACSAVFWWTCPTGPCSQSLFIMYAMISWWREGLLPPTKPHHRRADDVFVTPQSRVCVRVFWAVRFWFVVGLQGDLHQPQRITPVNYSLCSCSRNNRLRGAFIMLSWSQQLSWNHFKRTANFMLKFTGTFLGPLPFLPLSFSEIHSVVFV